MQHVLFISILVVGCEVRTAYASPFTFGNDARSINDRRFLFNRGESLSIGRRWTHRSLSARHHWIRASFARATPREEHVPPFDPWLMPGFRQIAIRSDDRRFSGPAIPANSRSLFIHEEGTRYCCEVDPSLFARRWKSRGMKMRRTSLLERHEVARTITSLLLFCLLERYITGASSASSRSLFRRGNEKSKKVLSYISVSSKILLCNRESGLANGP